MFGGSSLGVFLDLIIPAVGVILKCIGNVNKWFCLIVFIGLVSCVLPHIWAKRNTIRSGGYDYKSGGGFVVS